MAKSRTRRSAVPARWALQDAKNRLSEVVDAALRGVPQVVTRRGIEAAVIISHEEYTRMTSARDSARKPLAAYLLDMPRGDGRGDSEDPFERIALRSRRGV